MRKLLFSISLFDPHKGNAMITLVLGNIFTALCKCFRPPCFLALTLKVISKSKWNQLQ